MPGSAAGELNKRIDALVDKLDDLVGLVQDQAELRKNLAAKVESQARFTQKLVMAAAGVVMALAVAILFVGLHRSDEDRQNAKAQRVADRHQTCVTQNVTRSVMRDLLVSAQTELNASKPPPDLTPDQLENYNDQVSKAKIFYKNQIAKVKPLEC